MISHSHSPQTIPHIAVLLTVFNGMEWLQEQLDSILNQVNVALTIYISVDVSIDGSEEFVNVLAARDKRIIVLPHGVSFGGAAPNFFRLLKEVNFSSYDYVSFSDQDDIWNSNKLSAAIQLLNLKKVDAYSSNVIAFWENGRSRFIKKSQAQVKWDYFFEAAGPGCTYVLTQKLAISIQNFLIAHPNASKRIGLHDWFVYAYARANGYQWTIDEHSWLFYRQHSSNQVGINSGLKAFIHRAQKVSDGWALRQSILLADLLNKQNEPFVKIWSSGSSSGLLSLALHSWQCRRRLRDKILFFFSCIYMAVIGGIKP